jgi:hypothetical protein
MLGAAPLADPLVFDCAATLFADPLLKNERAHPGNLLVIIGPGGKGKGRYEVGLLLEMD